MPPEARDYVLAGIETNWGTGRLSAVLAPSVASQPGVKDWYGRVERYAASPGTALAKMRAISELDVRNVLPLVAAPTLVVHNRDDWFIRAGHGRYLAEHIPGARLLERDSADHWPIGDADLLGAIEEFVVGSRSEDSDVDRFLATVLFVDVAGSTERVSEIGDRSWDALLGRFETIVGRVLSDHRGELVNTAGDGVLATFDGPARGIRCAWSLRDSLKQTGLEVRSGIHTGELTRRNGGVAGIAVHIGARVSALAEPGEVLVTRTVRDLVAGSGIVFEDRGEHALKGVPGDWQLFAVDS
jgi:class 3 adenylate cyclase